MDGGIEENNSGLMCLKYLVLGFNTIFMMTGILLVSIGTTIFSFYYYFNEFVELRFFSPSTVLILSGGFIFFIAIVGFISVIKESTLLLNTYCVLLCFICILQLSSGISAILLRGRTEETVYEKMNASMHSYQYDIDSANAIDSVQMSLKCCGIFDLTDWKGVIPINRNYIYQDDIVLPDSCCEKLNFDGSVCLQTYNSGCLRRLKLLIYQSLKIVFGTCLTLSIIQLTGISFTHRLAKELIRTKSERLAHELIMRNQVNNIYGTMTFNGKGQGNIYDDKPPSYDELKFN